MSTTPEKQDQQPNTEPPLPSDNEGAPKFIPGSFSLDDFLPILMNLLVPRRILTTIPTFVPKTFVDSIQLYTDGTDTYLYVYVNNAWHAFMANGVQRLVAGPGISTSPGSGRGVVTVSGDLPVSVVLATRGGSDATGSQAIAHGLGKVPKIVRVTALWGANTPQLLQSIGTYSSGGMKNVNAYTIFGSGGGSGDDTTNIVVLSDRAGFSQIAAVSSLDATNLNLSWTQSGSPGLGGTIRMIVESYG
ncbi:MAG TPA: hypothetical protein VGF48_10325 [Thermoanaerobaculia bacterium]|jgi:hypothetical protein